MGFERVPTVRSSIHGVIIRFPIEGRHSDPTAFDAKDRIVISRMRLPANRQISAARTTRAIPVSSSR